MFALRRRWAQGLVLHHLGCEAEVGCVAAPEGWPGLGEMAQAEDEELGWVEEGPGAVGEVAGTHMFVRL